jgi:hypothetical protein
MDQGQIALQLMALHGKLRRATDAQVKAAVKHQIDALMAALNVEHRPALCTPEKRQAAAEP